MAAATPSARARASRTSAARTNALLEPRARHPRTCGAVDARRAMSAASMGPVAWLAQSQTRASTRASSLERGSFTGLAIAQFLPESSEQPAQSRPHATGGHAELPPD